MNRTKKYIYNISFSAALHLASILSGFIIPRTILQSYGSEMNGIISSVNQFISYFSIVEAGLGGAAMYALYKPLANKDYPAMNGIVSAAKKLYNQTGYIFASMVLGLALLFPHFTENNSLLSYEMGLLVVVLGLKGVLEFFTLAKYRVLLDADQKTYVIAIATIVHLFTYTMIVAILAHYHTNIIVLKAVSLCSVYLRSLILMMYVKRKYPSVNYNAQPDRQSMDKRWDVLYIQLLNTVLGATPGVVIAVVIRDFKLASVYSVFYLVVAGVSGILTSFKTGLSAAFGDLIARNAEKTIKKAYTSFEYLYYALLTVACSTMLITIMPFIRIYTRGIVDTNYDIPLLGVLFTINCLQINIMTPQRMLINSAGIYREMRGQTTTEAVLAIISETVLGYFYGVSGIVTGYIIAETYRAIYLLSYIPRNITKTRVKDSVIRQAMVYMAVALNGLLLHHIPYVPTNYLTWFNYALVVACVTGIITGIMWFLFDKNTAKEIYHTFLKKRWKTSKLAEVE